MINWNEMSDRNLHLEDCFEVSVSSGAEYASRKINEAMRAAGGTGEVRWMPCNTELSLDGVVETAQCVMDLFVSLGIGTITEIRYAPCVDMPDEEDLVAWSVKLRPSECGVYIPSSTDVSLEDVAFIRDVNFMGRSTG